MRKLKFIILGKTYSVALACWLAGDHSNMASLEGVPQNQLKSHLISFLFLKNGIFEFKLPECFYNT